MPSFCISSTNVLTAVDTSLGLLVPENPSKCQELLIRWHSPLAEPEAKPLRIQKSQTGIFLTQNSEVQTFYLCLVNFVLKTFKVTYGLGSDIVVW
jgi:uncharacterized membrane protein